MAADPVTDLRDLRVLIPETRRAIDGPQATGSASSATTLTDEMVLNLIADALSEVILYTGTAFGYELEVTERDDAYMAPIAWQTDRERDSNANTVIRTQAAINYHFRRLSEIKAQESIRDKDGEWSYSISANVLKAWLEELARMRDRALGALLAANPTLDSYVSHVAARDQAAARAVEPWVEEVGGVGGMNDVDWRFR